VLLLALALGSLGLSGSAGADPEPANAADPLAWDQAHMATLSENFYQAVKELRSSVRSAGTGATAGTQDRVRHEALDKLAHLERSARQLAAELKDGKSREETEGSVKRIVMLRNDTAELARRAMIVQETQDKLAAAGGILKKIEDYYGVD
jgi:hypothetical protein